MEITIQQIENKIQENLKKKNNIFELYQKARSSENHIEYYEQYKDLSIEIDELRARIIEIEKEQSNYSNI